MSKISCILLLGIEIILFSGCITIPPENLTLDFTDESVPVMLTPVESFETVKTLHFESGVRSVQMSSTSTRGNVTVTNTLSIDEDLNTPLDRQLQNTLVLSPEWTAVSGLTLNTFVFNMSMMGSYSRKEYRLVLDLTVPFEGRK